MPRSRISNDLTGQIKISKKFYLKFHYGVCGKKLILKTSFLSFFSPAFVWAVRKKELISAKIVFPLLKFPSINTASVKWLKESGREENVKNAPHEN